MQKLSQWRGRERLAGGTSSVVHTNLQPNFIRAETLVPQHGTRRQDLGTDAAVTVGRLSALNIGADMTATIGHRPSRNMSPVPSAFFTFAVIAAIAVIAVIVLVGVAALRSSDAPSDNPEVPAAPAAYVASPADLFEQRVAARHPAAYVASDADLFEQRVAG